LEVCVIERIDVRLRFSADHARQRATVGDGSDAIELRLEWSDSLRLDARSSMKLE